MMLLFNTYHMTNQVLWILLDVGLLTECLDAVDVHWTDNNGRQEANAAKGRSWTNIKKDVNKGQRL